MLADSSREARMAESSQMHRHAVRNWVLAIGVASLCAVLGTFVSLATGRLNDGTDLTAHYRWVVQFHQVLSEGTLYPRWLPLANGGLGEPTFVIIHPGWYYVIAMLHSAGLDVWLAMRAAATLSVFGLGLVAFHFLSPLMSLRRSLFGVAAVQLLPFSTFLLGFHAALPWHFSMPLALFVICRVLSRAARKQDDSIDLILALAVGALCVFHLMVAFMVGLSLVLGLLIRSMLERDGGAVRRLMGMTLSMGIGVGLAAFYWLPALTSGPLFVAASDEQMRHLDWRNSFAFPAVTSGVYGVRWALVQWWLAYVPLVQVLVVAFLLRWRGAELSASVRGAAVGLLSIGVVALVLASELSYFLYHYLPLLAKVQFPYRFLTVAFLACSLALVLAMPRACSVKRGSVLGVCMLSCSVLVASIAFSFALQLKQLRDVPAAKLGQATMEGLIGYPTALPASARAGWKDYVSQGGLDGYCSRSALTCEVTENRAHSRTWRITSSLDSWVNLPVFSFPAWELAVNGSEATVRTDEASGVISVAISPGLSEVRLRWAPLLQDWVGMAISALAVLTLVMVASRRRA